MLFCPFPSLKTGLSGAQALELECAVESPGGLVKAQVAAPSPAFDSMGDWWVHRIFILNKFSVDMMLLV